jgi:hypothetical protein
MGTGVRIAFGSTAGLLIPRNCLRELVIGPVVLMDGIVSQSP